MLGLREEMGDRSSCEDVGGGYTRIWRGLVRPLGEGNGNPLQYSCLEDSRDRGAWWAAVYGVAQGQTRLK